MYEIEIRNNKTNEVRIIYGYSIANAYERSNLNVAEWTVVYNEYID